MKNLVFLIILVTSFSIAQKNKEQNKNRINNNSATTSETFLIDVNRLKLPINNSGVIADVVINGVEGGRYDSKTVFFSAGFLLSGYSNGTMWTNAIASASRIQDYLKGQVNTEPGDPRNLVYAVFASDTPFGNSWQSWKDAVDIGADFYDGNNDGIYNPVDLNSNGIWDANEDKPDILGDITTYCVYNDGVDTSLRRFNDVTPKGIEIRQTIFAYSDSSQNTLNNTIFVRYKIVNRGTVSSVMDSVYFSFWADPDVGNYVDDLVGCDTLLDAGFVYHNAPDGEFGNAAPTVLTSILQGPYYYMPGETFIDNNSNGIYDAGIDTPIDTAYNRKGILRGIEIMPGARNQNMSSFIHYMSSHPSQGDPNTSLEARSYLLGKNKFGTPIDPCNWPFGSVTGVNCSAVNPVFMYSGNPAANTGWLNTMGTDQRTMVNTGPFKLKQNEPVEIIGALLVGRKDDPFSSFYEARRIASYVGSYYRSNFGQYPLGVEEEPSMNVSNFELYQNYPNPFNPVTKIKYQIPETGLVSLKVYNILGEVVTTIVNEIKTAGSYTIDFNAGNLVSGVYIYELKTSFKSSSKKLIILK
ncbi:MAG: T9SS type A sorting domain-containing protein [Ignavibacteria bacterium]|nr:T9SS type A sorting domain-containing protein [Ignavibacteria bacterium]